MVLTDTDTEFEFEMMMSKSKIDVEIFISEILICFVGLKVLVFVLCFLGLLFGGNLCGGGLGVPVVWFLLYVIILTVITIVMESHQYSLYPVLPHFR